MHLHFPNQQQPDQALEAGVHRIVRQASGVVRVGDEGGGALLLAQVCADARGLWLQVVAGARGVHVNGRPVRRCAQLRAGDAIFIDGVELLIRGTCQPVEQLPPRAVDPDDDVRVVLRAVGGHHHGRSFTLGPSLLIGSSSSADILIDNPAFAAEHARIERHGEQVLLRDLGSDEGSVVNGVEVRHCWLQPGDQLVLDGQHRFVLEDPMRARASVMAEIEREMQASAAVEPEVRPLPPMPKRPTHWPWLLLSAVLLAGVLAALLLFGAR